MSIKNLFVLISLMMFSLNTTAKQIKLSTLAGMYVIDICSEVLAEAYQRAGISLQIEKFPAKRALILSNSGKVDGEVARIKGAEKKYPNLVQVAPKICSMASRVYVKNTEIKLNGWESLQPYKIGIIRGHLYAAHGTRGMDVVSVKSNTLLFKMLDRGRVDVIIAQIPDALNTISEFKLQGIKGLDPIIASMPLYHYLHKKNIDLLPKIEQAINEMESEGRISAIEDAFISKLEKQIAIASKLPSTRKE